MRVAFLPADGALVMAITQKAPVGSPFADTVTNPAWKKKPTWYQVSTEDRRRSGRRRRVRSAGA